MFTLAHELAHIWLGETALSDVGPVTMPSNDIEVWCNQVAAELLVPLAILHDTYRGDIPLREELNHLARWFKDCLSGCLPNRLTCARFRVWIPVASQPVSLSSSVCFRMTPRARNTLRICGGQTALSAQSVGGRESPTVFRKDLRLYSGAGVARPTFR